MGKTMNLIVGILMLVLCAGSIYSGAMHGFTTRNLLFDAALLLFGISRFIMFKAPNAAIIKPLRTLAIVAALGGALMRTM